PCRADHDEPVVIDNETQNRVEAQFAQRCNSQLKRTLCKVDFDSLRTLQNSANTLPL
ncbi:hypothetical protein PIB30_115465, partial [Stylosanthes scabra]|nr:hypothetical protein [Stylosanthes scabra]